MERRSRSQSPPSISFEPQSHSQGKVATSTVDDLLGKLHKKQNQLNRSIEKRQGGLPTRKRRAPTRKARSNTGRTSVKLLVSDIDDEDRNLHAPSSEEDDEEKKNEKEALGRGSAGFVNEEKAHEDESQSPPSPSTNSPQQATSSVKAVNQPSNALPEEHRNLLPVRPVHPFPVDILFERHSFKPKSSVDLSSYTHHISEETISLILSNNSTISELIFADTTLTGEQGHRATTYLLFPTTTEPTTDDDRPPHSFCSCHQLTRSFLHFAQPLHCRCTVGASDDFVRKDWYDFIGLPAKHNFPQSELCCS